MKLKPYQQMLVDDGLPLACIATSQTMARARKYWDAHPPVSIPFAQIDRTRDESPETKAFRAQEEERKRLKSLAGIARMKTRFASKAIDYSKMRWDARRAKFVPIETGTTKSATVAPSVSAQPVNPGCATVAGTLTKDNAEAVAKLNSAWKPEYEKLRGTGRIVMTIGNILRGKIKRGEIVKWT